MRLIFLLLSNLALSGNILALSESAWLEEMYKAPIIDTSATTELTVIQGTTAHLQCKVKRLNNKTVSWIRGRDLQIISVGTQVHINDNRFLVDRKATRNSWTLMIRRSTANDSGAYICQVSSQPPISFQISLTVIIPETRITNSDDMYIDAGSLLNITCTVSATSARSAYVFWYHNSQAINYNSARGGVSVITHRGNITSSHLLITAATATDSGVYRCSPPDAPHAETRVHVLTGEKPAAMHTSSSAHICCRLLIFLFHLTMTGIIARYH